MYLIARAKMGKTNESKCLKYHKFLATMKDFHPYLVNFAEMNNIRENITYTDNIIFSYFVTFSCTNYIFSVKSIVMQSYTFVFIIN